MMAVDEQRKRKVAASLTLSCLDMLARSTTNIQRRPRLDHVMRRSTVLVLNY
jgi:hypothetical protein